MKEECRMNEKIRFWLYGPVCTICHVTHKSVTRYPSSLREKQTKKTAQIAIKTLKKWGIYENWGCIRRTCYNKVT